MSADNQQHGRAVDVVIVGGGMIGLSLALSLTDTDFSVAVIEQNTMPEVTDPPQSRVSAINRFALNHFRDKGVLEHELVDRLCVYDSMFVWEQKAAGQIKFDAAELGVSELGVIVENNVLQQMLFDRVAQSENISVYCPRSIIDINYSIVEGEEEAVSLVTLDNGDVLVTALLVGADGVKSRIRDLAKINRVQKSYQQQALVCNVTTALPHLNTAWQCFMPTGPLAFLPLYNGDSSIVWSLDDAMAETMMSLDDESFMESLAEAFEYRLGEVTKSSKRFLFPLTHAHAPEYVKAGLALVGDAAHNIHPLAGQGANLGVADAFALGETIIQARQQGRRWASLHTLKKYQRQRKGANMIMENSMTGFKELFGQANPLLQELRNAGLTLIDHLPSLKYRIIRQALGDS